MGGDAEAPFELKGWRAYFNSYTIKGRINCVVASVATPFVLYGLFKMTRGKKQIEGK
ncbi:ATP synthase F(0) complex subunit k, mitochondrial-like [Ciona intestinalis]